MGSKPPPKATTPQPEALQKDLAAILVTSKEILHSSKSLLQSSPHTVPSKTSVAILADVSTLVGLVHSHTVRTALTCGPTAFSPKTTLSCIKDLLQPILPLVAEMQSLTASDGSPEFFTKSLSRDIAGLFNAIEPFLDEVVEIAKGERSVKSEERLTYSGMVMHLCDQIQRVCQDGPMKLFQKTLAETQEMLQDAMDELAEIATSTADVENFNAWGDRVTYTPQQKDLAARGLTKLRLLSLLYKAISKRRLSTPTYLPPFRSTLNILQDTLVTLSSLTDDFSAGVAAEEDPMTMEITLLQIVEKANLVAATSRAPLTGPEDGREQWFDTWREKMT
jgi:Grap2 and cyclin-D-interacting, N-terminal